MAAAPLPPHTVALAVGQDADHAYVLSYEAGGHLAIYVKGRGEATVKPYSRPVSSSAGKLLTNPRKILCATVKEMTCRSDFPRHYGPFSWNSHRRQWVGKSANPGAVSILGEREGVILVGIVAVATAGNDTRRVLICWSVPLLPIRPIKDRRYGQRPSISPVSSM